MGKELLYQILIKAAQDRITLCERELSKADGQLHRLLEDRCNELGHQYDVCTTDRTTGIEYYQCAICGRYNTQELDEGSETLARRP